MKLVIPDAIAGDNMPRFVATLPLSVAEVARRALQGDQVARYVSRMSVPDRWFELVGDWGDDPPVDCVAAEARRIRRRAMLRGR